MTESDPDADPDTDPGPTAAPDTGAATGPEPSLDARRRRTLRRIVGTGVLVAAAVALLAGLAGATGQAGAAIFLLLSATTCAVAATHGVLTAVRDDLRDHRVSRARVGWIVGLFVAAAALMAMTAGAGG